MSMDKFAVEEEDELPTKNASVGTSRKCPDCASTLRDVQETGVLLCPKCGSKPFEKK